MKSPAYDRVLAPKEESKYLLLIVLSRQVASYFINFLFLKLVYHELMGEKEKNSKLLGILVIFSSTQFNGVKREKVTNLLCLSQAHGLHAPKVM